MEENIFAEKKKKRKISRSLLVCVVLIALGIVGVVSVTSNQEDNAIVLNDIESKGCITFYCFKYKELGYDVSYYQAGDEFKPGIYTLKMSFDESKEDNQYMIVETANSDSIKYPYLDGRFISLDLFGLRPQEEDYYIYNMPLVKNSDLEILYKQGYNAQAELIPQNYDVDIDLSSGVSEPGFYVVGVNIAPGKYEISSDKTDELPFYTIFDSDGELDNTSEVLDLEIGQTLVLNEKINIRNVK